MLTVNSLRNPHTLNVRSHSVASAGQKRSSCVILLCFDSSFLLYKCLSTLVVILHSIFIEPFSQQFARLYPPLLDYKKPDSAKPATMDARVERSTGGTTPIGIAGRMVRERERLLGMSVEERAWRKQYLADQHLSAREPVHVPEYVRELKNPIRRLYQAPLDRLYGAVKPIVVRISITSVLYKHGPSVQTHSNRTVHNLIEVVCLCVWCVYFSCVWVLKTSLPDPFLCAGRGLR